MLNIEKNKRLYLFIVGVAFIISMMSFKYICPCDDNDKKERCYRFEIWGLQVNHLFFFMFLGFLFHEYFYLIQLSGIVWEIFEYYIKFNDWILNYMGGCFDKKTTKNTFLSQFYVYKDNKKKMNPIDEFFNLDNSTKQWWHYSVAIIFVNILGFMIGKYMKKTLKINYKMFSILFAVLIMTKIFYV